MSYCRFEGTRAELDACLSAVDDHVYEEAEYEVSQNEIDQFREMIWNFVGWMQDQSLLTEDGDVDSEVLDSICAKMAQGYSVEED